MRNKPARHYFHCQHCDLIFLDPAERLASSEEKARYDLHQNEDSAGYRKFLQPLVEDICNYSQLVSKYPTDLKVLDYGCGPSAFFRTLLAESSLQAVPYDPFYFPDPSPLQTSYDVITSTEVWEHFHQPSKEIKRLRNLLKPLGLLAVMTSAHPGVKHFAEWQYRRDPTHVVFFSTITMEWIGGHFHLELLKAQSPYWIFRKPVSDSI